MYVCLYVVSVVHTYLPYTEKPSCFSHTLSLSLSLLEQRNTTSMDKNHDCNTDAKYLPHLPNLTYCMYYDHKILIYRQYLSGPRVDKSRVGLSVDKSSGLGRSDLCD